MSRGTIFWGSLLVIVGGVLLLNNLGLLGDINVWGIIWPLALIAIGAWIIWGASSRRRQESEHLSVALDSAQRARLKLQHAAGKLVVNSGAPEGLLFSGDFKGGIELHKSLKADQLDVRLNPDSLAWFPGSTFDWNITLSSDIRLVLEVETGASDSQLILTDVLLDELYLKSGANAAAIALPANAGFTRARIESGATSVEIRIPEGVAASIRSQSGLSSVMVDRDRFPRQGGAYQSPDYAEAANKVDLDIQIGVGSVAIR